MAMYKITGYRLGWSLKQNVGGFVQLKTAEAGESKPIKLTSPDQVAAVGTILNGDAPAYWDTDHAALICGGSAAAFQQSKDNVVDILGGGMPFPLGS